MANNESQSVINTWQRNDVSACDCEEKLFTHVHCPCWNCRGKATCRSTEIRHWREASLIQNDSFIDSDISSDMDESEDAQEEATMNFCVESEAMDIQEETEGREQQSTVNIESTINDEQFNPIRKLVVEGILDALTIKEDSGGSIKTFEDILKYGKKMLLTSIGDDVDIDILCSLWPNNWNQAQSLLKEEGFDDAKEYYICICRESRETTYKGQKKRKYYYSRKWSVMDGKDEECPNCGNTGYIKYCYLGLKSKVKNWFKNETMCKKMLAHWEERDHWLGRELSWPMKKEIWDGQRWIDIQWFWDPSKTWTLPTRCLFCNDAISADILLECSKDDNGNSLVDCPNCLESFTYKLKTAKGCPLNLALIGHWDAWQPFRTSKRSCGSFEVSIANMYKKKRSHVDEVYVVGFVPCTSVPCDIPERFDPFLEPLMNDLTEGFINGFQVQYPPGIDIDQFQPHPVTTVRVLLICWSGDHPGQCEIGKFLNQGKCPCRRCKLKGQQSQLSNRYYYGDNRKHIRYPWEPRDIMAEEDNLYDVANETRKTVRKQLSSDIGLTGISILHKYLYPLYKFDVLHHTIIDVFHTVPLNLCKNQMQRLLELELLDNSYLDDEIKTFPWDAENKNGRLPVPVGKDNNGLSYWKAEGLQKFAYPMLECILEGKLDDWNELEILGSVSRFTELHFVCGRDGWSNDMIELHKVLAQRLNVKIEEVQGLEMCTISVHNMLHIHEDILNFSATDNYWCAVFERAVKSYVKKSHNCKEVEKSYAGAEMRREFLKGLEVQVEKPHKQYDLKQGIVCSVDTAKHVCNKDNCNLLLIGTVNKVEELNNDEHQKLAATLMLPISQVSSVCLIAQKCYFRNLGFEGATLASNDSAIVSLLNNDTVVSISKFLSVNCQGTNYQLVGKGTIKPFYVDASGQRVTNVLNAFPKVRVEASPENAFFLISDVKRKVILYDCGNSISTVVDYTRKLRNLPYRVVAPVYPENDDMLIIQGQFPDDLWYGKVVGIDHESQTVDVYFFVKKPPNDNILVREVIGRGAKNTVSLDCVISIAEGLWVNANCWEKAT